MKKQTKELIKIIAFIMIILAILIIAWYYVLPKLTLFGRAESVTNYFAWD